MTVEEHIVAQQFEGPLPPPSTLAQYNNIQKGFADRIVTLAENESNHRHEMDKKFLDANIKLNRDEVIEARIGQFCGLIIGLAAIFGGSYTAMNGSQITGSLIGTSGVVGLVSAFILGRKKPKNNNKTKEVAPPPNNIDTE